jgi:hypothetical protein
MICTPHPILLGDKIEKNGMSGYAARMGEKRGSNSVWWGNLRERDHLGDPD